MAAKTAIRDRIVGLRRVKASKLKPHPKNWRRHPDSQVAAMRGVLGEIGYADALLARETRGGLELIDGHLRRDLDPNQTVPVLVLDLTKKEADKLLAVFDPLADMAEVDVEALAALLPGVDTADAGLAGLLDNLKGLAGLDGSGIEEEGDVDLTPPKKPKSKRGEIYELGPHRLMCGDSTAGDDVRELMAGEQAQLVFTDPPYGVNYTGGMKPREQLSGDEVGTDIYGRALPMLRFAADDQAALYLWYADAHAAAAAAAAAAAGYQITAQIIWVKNHAQFVTSAKYKGKHEPCFYAHRKGKTARWHGPNNEVTVWEYDRAPVNEYHPTQKPPELARRAITNSSAPSDTVLDLFMGSGSTMIGAQQVERVCNGMELDPAYCDVVRRRYAEFVNDPKLAP
jgi:DNA modification methylase